MLAPCRSGSGTVRFRRDPDIFRVFQIAVLYSMFNDKSCGLREVVDLMEGFASGSAGSPLVIALNPWIKPMGGPLTPAVYNEIFIFLAHCAKSSTHGGLASGPQTRHW